MAVQPSDTQINSLLELIVELKDYYAELTTSVLEIKLHKEVAVTQCPGTLFPWLEIKQSLAGNTTGSKGGIIVEAWKSAIMSQAKEAGLIHDEHQPDEPAPKWFVLEVGLNILKSLSKK